MQLNQNQPVQIFNRLLQKFRGINHQDILQKADTIYAVRQFKIGHLTLENASQIYQNISYKFNRHYNPNAELNWWQNELRIFVWTLILYVELKRTKIEELTSNDWEYFSKIFPNKKLILFEYQSINILKQHGQAKKWVSEQDELFCRLVNDKGQKCKWSQLAKLLYIQSQRLYFRAPKQCRQRWLNHLDPSKSKHQWQPKEDYILIRYVNQKGKKWAEISKILSNKRNQHSIKNRFKSLVTKEQKFHKQKLSQPELISFIYKRYVNHFKLSESSLSKIPQSYFQQENTQNQTKKIKLNQLMQPFTYVSKPKQLTKFLPYHQLDLTPPQIHRSTSQTLETHSENKFSELIHSRFQGISKSLKRENQFYKSFEEPHNQLERDFCSSNFLPAPQYESHNNLDQFTKNQDDYFPTFDSRMDQYFTPLIPNRVQQQQNESDQKEKQIRADLFVVDDPFQLLRPFLARSRSGISQPNLAECKSEV